jgi:serine/threonine-protein kinase
MSDLLRTLQGALGPGYRLERELGGGGMSRVFLAEEVALGRRVVVKVLPPELEVALSGERFAREVQLAARLNHPTIVPVLAAGTGNGLAWYTMPFVEGESLRARLAAGTPLPLADALRWGRDLFEAVAAAHAKGVVHRDIKPENVLLHGTRASLADFGIARAVQASTNAERLTATGVALGTPAYMAPEQAVGDPGADQRVDLYAAGLVLYEMLAGRGPFDGRSPSQLVAAHLTLVPPPLRRFRADVPPALEAIVMRCLAKEPGERPTSANEVRDVLEGLLAEATAVRAVAAPARRRRTLVLVAGAAGAVVIAAAVARWIGGPVAKDGAAGASAKDLILMADVAAAPADSMLAHTIGEALRIDLQGSSKLRFPDVARLQRVRATLQLAPTAPMPLDTALAVARRLGAKAVVGASLERVGSGFVLSARLVATEDGVDLAALREAADDSSSLLPAMDRLGRGLRERAGESLRSLEARIPLPLLTTRSFPALERAAAGYVQLARFSNRDAADQFAQAIQLDSTFAAAWFGYAQALAAINVRPDSQLIALTRAFALRDHLTAAERARIEARWARLEHRASDASIALRRALAEAPDDDNLRRELASELVRTGRHEEAAVIVDSILDRDPADQLARAIALETALRAGDTAAAGRIARDNPLAGTPPAYRLLHQERLANRDWRQSSAYADSALALLRGDRRAPSAMGGQVANALVLGRFQAAARLAEERRTLALGIRDSALALEAALQGIGARVVVLGDRVGARRALDAALALVPLAALPPVSRPYENVAILAAMVGDVPRAEAWLAERERALPRELTPFLRRVDVFLARGWIALARARPADALAQFDLARREVERDGEVCTAGCFDEFRATAFEAMAEPDSAEAAWRRFLDVRSTGRVLTDPIFLAHAYRWLATRYAERGDTANAVPMARALVMLWEDADPPLQPVVAEMRALIARLEARRG